ncbi:hypothetical protein AAMO2058_000193600 [Amorphochlora amoebiformis]
MIIKNALKPDVFPVNRPQTLEALSLFIHTYIKPHGQVTRQSDTKALRRNVNVTGGGSEKGTGQGRDNPSIGGF